MPRQRWSMLKCVTDQANTDALLMDLKVIFEHYSVKEGAYVRQVDVLRCLR